MAVRRSLHGRFPPPQLLPTLAGILLAGLPGGVSAQSISGHVVEEGSAVPIPSAAVTLVDSTGAAGPTSTADSTGYFRVAAPAGRYRVRVERIGYTSHTSDEILLRAGEPVIVELRMAPRGVPLEALVVEARGREQGRRGFLRRRELGTGTFMTPDSVKLRYPRLVTDAFRAAGAILLGGFGRDATLSSMRGHRCMAVFVDHEPRPYAMFLPRDSKTTWSLAPDTAIMALGAPVNSAELLNTLFYPEDILGMEVYSEYNEVPDELRTAGRTTDIYPCGFAIIWTTRGW